MSEGNPRHRYGTDFDAQVSDRNFREMSVEFSQGKNNLLEHNPLNVFI